MPILKTKLHELRKENNMQQAELAKLVGSAGRQLEIWKMGNIIRH